MTLTNVYIIENGVLAIETYLDELPVTSYTETYLRNILKNKYGNNVADFLVHVGSQQRITLLFSAEDYIGLAEIIKEQAQYNLKQARTIISWIEQVVAGDSPDSSWGTVYCEILEGASNE